MWKKKDAPYAVNNTKDYIVNTTMCVTDGFWPGLNGKFPKSFRRNG